MPHWPGASERIHILAPRPHGRQGFIAVNNPVTRVSSLQSLVVDLALRRMDLGIDLSNLAKLQPEDRLIITRWVAMLKWILKRTTRRFVISKRCPGVQLLLTAAAIIQGLRPHKVAEKAEIGKRRKCNIC